MRKIIVLTTLLILASCGKDQSTGDAPVQGTPQISPTPAPPASSDLWKRIEEMYPINQLIEGEGASGVAVISRESRRCSDQSGSCIEFNREKNPSKYRPGDYIFEQRTFGLFERPNLTDLVRECLNQQVREVARLDELDSNLVGVYKFISLNSINVYQRPYRVLSRTGSNSDLGEAVIKTDVTWRSKRRELNGKNVIVFDIDSVINQDEPTQCSVLSAQRLLRALKRSRSFAAGESVIF